MATPQTKMPCANCFAEPFHSVKTHPVIVKFNSKVHPREVIDLLCFANQLLRIVGRLAVRAPTQA
jgi:hypothetical protein